jgi:hypothetical protein
MEGRAIGRLLNTEHEQEHVTTGGYYSVPDERIEMYINWKINRLSVVAAHF